MTLDWKELAALLVSALVGWLMNALKVWQVPPRKER